MNALLNLGGGLTMEELSKKLSCFFGMDYFKGKGKEESQGKSRIQGVPFFYRRLLLFS